MHLGDDYFASVECVNVRRIFGNLFHRVNACGHTLLGSGKVHHAQIVKRKGLACYSERVVGERELQVGSDRHRRFGAFLSFECDVWVFISRGADCQWRKQ